MKLLSAKPVTEKIYTELKTEIEVFQKKNLRKPKLVVIIVGEDPASLIYTTKKKETALKLGMESEIIRFTAHTKSEDVFKTVSALNENASVDGILIQRPLPKSFKEEEVLLWINPQKDVDAFHPIHIGNLSLGLPCFKPCTPAGVMEILKYYEIPLAEKVACVVGRSSIVGKPMAALLLQADCTVVQAHSRTQNLLKHTREADLLIVAAGKPHLIGKEHIQPGTVVIDVGIHRDANNKVIGDVRFDEVAQLTSAITPVPGGVGPMTIAMLLQNTVLGQRK